MKEAIPIFREDIGDLIGTGNVEDLALENIDGPKVNTAVVRGDEDLPRQRLRVGFRNDEESALKQEMCEPR